MSGIARTFAHAEDKPDSEKSTKRFTGGVGKQSHSPYEDVDAVVSVSSFDRQVKVMNAIPHPFSNR